MYVLPGSNERIARALGVIEAGERLAQACVERQLDLARSLALDDATLAFLRDQARQESVHATFFGAGSRLFGGGAIPQEPASALGQYAHSLHAALDRGALLESLIGMQCVFEALGDCVLNAFERSPSPKVKLFAEFRRRIAREEATHHAFGLRAVRAHLVAEPWRAAEAFELTRSYVQRGDSILAGSLPLFADLGADCDACARQFRAMIRSTSDRTMRVAA